MVVSVAQSSKGGKGVFASCDFKMGDFILDIRGKRVSDVDALSMSSHFLNHMGAVSLHEWIVWDVPERFINHSCVPNVFERGLKIFAMRDISKGDELLFDYSMNGVEGVDDWRMKCRCNSSECRKMVYGSFFKLPVVLQKKYVPFLDDWFVSEFKSRLDVLF